MLGIFVSVGLAFSAVERVAEVAHGGEFEFEIKKRKEASVEGDI